MHNVLYASFLPLVGRYKRFHGGRKYGVYHYHKTLWYFFVSVGLSVSNITENGLTDFDMISRIHGGQNWYREQFSIISGCYGSPGSVLSHCIIPIAHCSFLSLEIASWSRRKGYWLMGFFKCLCASAYHYRGHLQCSKNMYTVKRSVMCFCFLKPAFLLVSWY